MYVVSIGSSSNRGSMGSTPNWVRGGWESERGGEGGEGEIR